MADSVPGLALLGSGVFASSQYIPKLGELVDLISLKVIWSRSEVHLVLINLQLINTKFVEIIIWFPQDVLSNTSNPGHVCLDVRMLQRRLCSWSNHMHRMLKRSGAKRVWIPFFRIRQSMLSP